MPLTRIIAPIKAYYEFIALRNYDAAYHLFQEQLDKQTLYGIGEISSQRVPLLEALFPDGIETLPPLCDPQDQLTALYKLGLTYITGTGLPGRAIKVYKNYIALAEKLGDEGAVGVGLGDIAKALRQTGHLYESEALALRGLILQRKQGNTRREAVNLYRYGLGLAQRGVLETSERALNHARHLFHAEVAEQLEGMVTGFLAQRALWLGDVENALFHARRTWEIADGLAKNSNQTDLNGIFKVRTAAARMIAEGLMLQGQLDEAETWIDTGLSTAHLIHMVEEMTPILHVKTELARRRGYFDLAEIALQDTWEITKTGEYVLYQADSHILQARLHADMGDNQSAIREAQVGYRLAWCDGPPFAYQRALQESQAILEQLGGDIPDLPIYEVSRLPPLPEITL